MGILLAVVLNLFVQDPSGAGMKAKGVLEPVGGGAAVRFETGPDGSKEVDAPAGRYRLSVTADGFSAPVLIVEVEDGKPARQVVKMAVGTASYSVNVVGTTPLGGLDRAVEEIPTAVQGATHRELASSGVLDLSDFLNRRMRGVFINEIQGNPFQADVNYRGYTASPLVGTPQGLSLFLDGVRQNQPFGDIVSWDLIPRIAIAETALIAGADPVFGLNTLGGAIALRTKDGAAFPGTAIQLGGGSFGRKTADFEHGGSRQALDWFLASSLFFEDGWRDYSPTNVRQFFGRVGWRRDRTSIGLSLGYANNALIGNALQEQTLLSRKYSSVYTIPDITANKAPWLNLQLRHSFSPRVSLSGNAYFRYIRSRLFNGDLNEGSLDQSVYQPNAAERTALAAAGYTGFPTAGESAANTPFPRWRCIANALRRDEPGEKCNGLLTRSASQQRNFGASAQISWFDRRHTLTAGFGYDGNSAGFTQLAELGYLNPDRSITGVGAFGDGITGGDIDGDPFDTRVNLSGKIHTGSFYATDSVSLGHSLRATLSGRINRTVIDNLDRIRPRAGAGSLTGHHTFTRFNPSAGLTWKGVYFNYAEGSRTPTSIELGCADPATPCKLPNAMAGDPPLKQVVSRTLEAGIRGGGESPLRWSAGWFRGANRDDILFVASKQTGFGYFKNFGRTLRQGTEFDASARIGRALLGASYTYLRATFESAEEVNGAGNSTNGEGPGLEGLIGIEPGSRIPLTPSHITKAYADITVTSKFTVSPSVIGIGGAFARGNENNEHRPDGRYYLGPGRSPGYGVANLAARYTVNKAVEFVLNVNNLFDRKYYSSAQLGPVGFNADGNFLARPFPAVNGQFPLRNSTFFAPGAPRGAWAGLRIRF
jgi:outer membrane receptor protein involved in Fe transport